MYKINMTKFIYSITITALLIFPLGLIGQNESIPSGVRKITSVEGITEYHLDNGLKVLLFPDQTKQRITVNITYLVGSRHENYGETGMAHLLEHLLFKGTPRHKDIPGELSARGMLPNGTTWLDRTNYFETFRATDENLNWALDLEADRMVNSFVAKKDLDSEFSVVRNEMENGENNPFSVLSQKTMASAYLWHNYGKSTIGARSDVENVPIDRLKAFYKKYYQPDNAVLLIAGKFDEKKTIGLVKKYFGVIPKPKRVIPANYTVEPIQDGERQVTIRRVGDTQLVMAGYHIPPGSHKDAAAIDILNTILTDTPSGRLYKSLVETKKASSISGFNFQTKEPGFHLYGAQLGKTDSIDDVREGMIETIEGVAKETPTKAEVDRARRIILKDIELSLNDPNRVGITMSEWIALGDWRLFFLHRDRLRKATLSDVQRVAAKYYKRSNRTVGIFIPTDKPDRSDIPTVRDSDITAALKDYKGDAEVAAGEAFDPSPANVEARTKRLQIGGLKVAFLTKENRGDTVVANINFRFGDEKSLMNRLQAARFAGQMLMRGTNKRTRQQIQDEFDRLKARVNVSGSVTDARASIQTTRQNLPSVLKLVAEILREPSFPSSEFDQLKKQTLTEIESQRTSPRFLAIQSMRKHFNLYPKGHPSYFRSIDEQISDINATTLDDVKRFYKDFYGGSVGEMTVVGDFDQKQIEALANKLFLDWKSPKAYLRIKDFYTDIKPVNQSLETPDKANAFFIAGVNLNIKDSDPDYPALVLGNYMFGGGFLNSRFLQRIRQKDGISYGGGSRLFANTLDPLGMFVSFAIYAPENVSKIETAFKEEVDKVLKTGFTEKEITDAKKGWLQRQELDRSNDGALARRLNRYLFLTRTIAWDAEFEKKVSNLTAAQINAALKKHIMPAKISIFKAGDFAKAKNEAPKKPKEENVKASASDLDAYIGDYQLLGLNSIITISRDGNKLLGSLGGIEKLELKFLSGTKFTVPSIGETTVLFKKDTAGKVTGLTLMSQGQKMSAKKIK